MLYAKKIITQKYTFLLIDDTATPGFFGSNVY